MRTEPIEIISCTRMGGEEFMLKAPLGQSLNRLRRDSRINSRVFADNRTGLSTVYNQVIAADGKADALVFLHDDVWIDDIYFVERILDALDAFDVVGVAGTRRRLPRQVIWGINPDTGKADVDYLSGALGQGKPLGLIARIGPVPAPCVFLDGVLLAARRSTLRGASLQFDPRFEFHFYDLDFTRSASERGLKVGTWPVSITHRSVGDYDSPSWSTSRELYLAKWGD